MENGSFPIPLHAKVALLGKNSSEKTTLFHMILGHEDEIQISPKAEIGYFAQTGYKYKAGEKLIEFMRETCDYQESQIRMALASIGFSQKDIDKDLSVLSGGELIKLNLVKMLLGRYNILLMDEPSNFLDVAAIEALEAMMKRYTGTSAFISHDKRLCANVADIAYQIQAKQLQLVSQGSYANEIEREDTCR